MPTSTLAVNVYGAPGSIEYEAACSFRDLIVLPATLENAGFISIHTDLYFPGEKREQIDLLLHAYFPGGLTHKVGLIDGEAEITFHDILAVIEVKAHRKENVLFSGTNAEVLYNGVWKSASSQSHQQVHSVKPFLKRELGWAPWICNLIFFSNLIEQDLPSGQRNYIAADSSIDVLLRRLCLSRKLTASQAKNHAAIFTCIPALNDEERSIRNEQLKNLLRTERAEQIAPRSKSSVRNSTQAQSSPSFHLPQHVSSASWRPPRQRSRMKFWKALLALGVLGWIGITATYRHVIHIASTSEVSATRPPVFHLCVMVTPSCGCFPRGQFRHGKTVVVQFIGQKEKPVSAAIHEPGGEVIPLTFHNLNLSTAYFAGSCFIAKHTIEQTAPMGSYFVQTSYSTSDGKPEGAISQGFQVVR